MKKFAWLAFLAGLVLTAGCLFTASAEEMICGDFAYVLLDDGTAEIKQYKGSDDTVVIPDRLNGYPVTSIGEFAFDRLYSGLASVTIPEGVTAVKDFAFSDCGNLSFVSLPDSVTVIGAMAFRNCAALTSLTLPENLEEIGDQAFMGCSRLTALTLPDSISIVGVNPFQNNSLETLAVSPGHPYLTVTDGVLFTRPDKRLVCCTRAMNRKSYEVPQGTLAIGDKAFENCFWLASVTIPDSVTSIGEEAFFRCPSLVTVRIPASVTSIGEYIFDRRHDTPAVIVDRDSYADLYCRGCAIAFIYAEPGD